MTNEQKSRATNELQTLQRYWALTSQHCIRSWRHHAWLPAGWTPLLTSHPAEQKSLSALPVSCVSEQTWSRTRGGTAGQSITSAWVFLHESFFLSLYSHSIPGIFPIPSLSHPLLLYLTQTHLCLVLRSNGNERSDIFNGHALPQRPLTSLLQVFLTVRVSKIKQAFGTQYLCQKGTENSRKENQHVHITHYW